MGAGREYERLGLDDAYYEILGLPVPLLRMPVAPGRNLAILVEVAARNQMLRARGHHAARKLAARLERQLLEPDAGDAGPEADRDDEDGGRSVTRGVKRAVGARRAGDGSRFVVLTGLSGAGKSQAIRALEDLGYFCVDNLPLLLVPTLAELSLRAGAT